MPSACCVPAKAAFISLIPSDSDVFTGEFFDVEVWITDLQPDEVVFIMDLTALFDPAVLNLIGSSFGSGLGGVTDSYQEHSGNSLYEYSFLDDVSLKALQGPAFTLFTLNFQAIAPSLNSVISLENNPFGLLNYELLGIETEIAFASINIFFLIDNSIKPS